MGDAGISEKSIGIFHVSNVTLESRKDTVGFKKSFAADPLKMVFPIPLPSIQSDLLNVCTVHVVNRHVPSENNNRLLSGAALIAFRMVVASLVLLTHAIGKTRPNPIIDGLVSVGET